MKREYAEAYVKWVSAWTPDLGSLSAEVWVCAIFVVPCAIIGIGNGRPFFAVLDLILLISCGVVVELFKQKVKQWTYLQSFLLRGGHSLAVSVILLLMALSVWESQMDGVWWCQLLTLGIWLLGQGVYFYIPWRKASQGVYDQMRKMHKSNKWWMEHTGHKSWVAGCSGVLAGSMGQSVARATMPHLSHGVAISVGVAAILFLSLILGAGSNELLRAYYVKKYDLQGKTTPVCWQGDGAGKPLGWRVLDAARKVGKVVGVMIAFSVIATLAMVFFMRWLPEWQGRM